MRNLPGIFVIAIAVFAMSCEPPGKPKPEPPSEQDITDFTFLYSNNCQACHGVDGKNGPARPLNDPLYLAVIPRDQLRATVQNGRPGTAMPAWARERGGALTEKQIDAVVDGIENNWAKPANFQGAKLVSYTGDGKAGDAANGKKLFTRACFMCHGPGAPIGSVTDGTFLQLVSDQVLRTSIIEGRPDLGMPDYRTLNLGHALSDQDIADLVAYMTSLRPNAPNVQELHTIENGSGQTGTITKGNEGSGNGPGSPQQRKNEGNKGNSSQAGGIK